MKWFDKEEVKDKERLSDSEIEYLRKPSFSIFGPLNIIARNHWDFFLTAMGLSILSEFVGDEGTMASFALAWIVLGFYAWLLYFEIMNSRRLAWNRNKWGSFKDFQDSENRWTPWGYLMFAIIILTFAGSFIQGFLEV
ncbi:MAG TPA: hypothetical protein PLN18_03050 [Candidatus Colwellbacteria bacterium]|nr:hypothetical protein [Candidatus Colwellbacteria bacterium]